VPTTLSLANQQRESLHQQEQEIALQLARRYTAAYQELETHLAALSQAIEAAGDQADPRWLQRQRTYQRLLDGAQGVFGDYGVYLEQTVVQQQAQAMARGLHDGPLLVASSGISNVRRPAQEATRTLTTRLTRRLEALDLRRVLPATVVDTIQNGIRRGMRLGQSAGRLLGQVKHALGGLLGRIISTNRTETTTAYRSATHLVYETNSIRKWQWAARIDRRPAPCAACIALHGRIFTISEPFGTHPNCFCLALPLLDGVPPPITEAGSAWFARQDDATMRDILGPSKLRSYQEGTLTLDALVGYRVHETYGPVRWERSLRSLGLEG
jgi:SPP1 gp7 family putative phage head morphogenesis protein